MFYESLEYARIERVRRGSCESSESKQGLERKCIYARVEK